MHDPQETFRARQQAIVQLGLLCAGNHDVQGLLDEACRLVAEGVGVQRAKVLERRASGALFVRAGIGWPPGFVGAVELPWGSESQAAFALPTAASGDATVITTSTPRGPECTERPGLASQREALLRCAPIAARSICAVARPQ